jgi:hypothetical protein
MKRNLVLAISLTMVLTIACKKQKGEPVHDGKNCLGEKCYILSGQVLNAKDSTPIANASILLYRFFGSHPLVFSKRLLARTVSNDMGVYTIQFDGSGYENIDKCGYYVMDNYRLEAYKDLMISEIFPQDKFNPVAEFNLCSENYNTPFVQDLFLYHGANLSLVVREKSSNQLLIKQISISSSGKKTVYFAETTPVKEKKIALRVAGNDSCHIKATVEINGALQQQSKTVFLPANSSNEVIITF